MSSSEFTDLKDKENELALEQAKMERIRMELELEKLKQESALPPDRNNVRGESEKPESKSLVSQGLIFCLMFLAPIGIIIVWRRKDLPIFIKILLTLFGLAALYAIVGWMLGWYYMERWPIILAW